MWSSMRSYLEKLPSSFPEPPRALVVISAHWIEREFTVYTHEKPGMYYDYGGFPEHTYKLQFPAPGSPDLAGQVMGLIRSAGMPVKEEAKRGYDHGVFVPLLVSFPDPSSLPIVVVSLKRGIDPAEHLALGRALAPLRDQGVAIIGSGFSFHNMRKFFEDVPKSNPSKDFADWVRETAELPRGEREKRVLEYTKAPGCAFSHPPGGEEHLTPLFVVLGAALDDERGKVDYRAPLRTLDVIGIRVG